MTNSEPMFTQGVNIENKECQVNMYGSGWRSRMNKRNWEGTVKNVGGELRKKMINNIVTERSRNDC